jgi:hypothetical protein
MKHTRIILVPALILALFFVFLFVVAEISRVRPSQDVNWLPDDIEGRVVKAELKYVTYEEPHIRVDGRISAPWLAWYVYEQHTYIESTNNSQPEEHKYLILVNNANEQNTRLVTRWREP